MPLEEDGSAAFRSPDGSENIFCSLSFSSFLNSSKMDSHRVTALKYAFSTVFYILERGQELLHVLLRTALSWMVLRYPAALLESVLRSRCKL